MARPLKNNADYFPHDAGMRNHKKVKAIRSKFGIQGYGIWSMLLEHLTGSDGNVFPYTDLEFELMSGDFGVSATEIRQVVDYCIIMEMLFNENGFIKSESLDERLAPVYEKRKKSKELSKQQLRANGKFVVNNTESSGESVTETPQSKVKESKVKKNKEEENKLFGATEVATIDERKKVFMNKVALNIETYGKEMLREFFDYWTEMNEGGKKMRFEMQKVFDIKRRLKTWDNNNKFRGNGKSAVTKIIEQQSNLNALIESKYGGKAN